VIRGLVAFCDEHAIDLEMMEFIEREIGFIIASAREIVDTRKTQRESELTVDAVVSAAKKNGLLVE